ncbi:MAG: hypothetical protein UZ17_ACD001000003 [Acidobacteria bacterium OLB17]|nr:MAG: hypothetical protein UZ17_ACD001000003 [Acidobacteria bacterium OLB17]MCZ2390086.1 hypothetical protein [Acidobacteriota bacterium]
MGNSPESEPCIMSNYVQSENFRKIDVEIDGRNFTAEGLERLFMKLSAEYSSPKFLTIVVTTEFPPAANSQLSGTGSSRVQVNETGEGGNRATFYRRGANVFFEYSTANAPDDVKTVVLSGSAI